MKIDTTEVVGIAVRIDGLIRPDQVVEVGTITLTKSNRQYIIDTFNQRQKTKHGNTIIETDLLIEPKDFPNCPYNITDEDLKSGEVKGTIFIGGNFSNRVDSATIFFLQGKKEIEIDLEEEE